MSDELNVRQFRAGRPPIWGEKIREHEEEVRQRIECGHRAHDLARWLGCSESTIWKLKKKLPDIAEILSGLDKPLQKVSYVEMTAALDGDTLDRVRAIRAEGGAYADVAELVGVPEGLIRRWETRSKALAAALACGDVVKELGAAPALGRLDSRESLDQITIWCRNGMSEDGIAALLGLLPEEWARVARESEAVNKAIRLGRAQAEETATRRLWELMQDSSSKDHAGAIKFALSKRWAPPKPTAAPATQPRATETKQLSPEEILAALGGDNE